MPFDTQFLVLAVIASVVFAYTLLWVVGFTDQEMKNRRAWRRAKRIAKTASAESDAYAIDYTVEQENKKFYAKYFDNKSLADFYKEHQ